MAPIWVPIGLASYTNTFPPSYFGSSQYMQSDTRSSAESTGDAFPDAIATRSLRTWEEEMNDCSCYVAIFLGIARLTSSYWIKYYGDHSDKLRNHLGRAQGWESVC